MREEVAYHRGIIELEPRVLHHRLRFSLFLSFGFRDQLVRNPDAIDLLILVELNELDSLTLNDPSLQTQRGRSFDLLTQVTVFI